MTGDLSEQMVDGINATYGVHPGFRAVHAKGVLCAGTFTPSSEAAALSRAPHLAGATVRAHVRFSNGSGDPTLADSVRRCTRDGDQALPARRVEDRHRCDLAPRVLRAHAEDLLAFNEARRPAPTTGEIDVAKVGAYLAEHGEAIAAVTAAMTHPIPSSFATLAYHALHSFGFVAADGNVRYGRYHLDARRW